MTIHTFLLSQPLRVMSSAMTILLVSLLSQACATTSSGPAEQQRLVEEATVTFERFLDNPGLAFWYRAQQKSIKAVLIVPRLVRGAFVAGVAGGKGVLLARDYVRGGWSPPAFYSMDVASIGLQAGADASEVVLIVQSFAGLERFYGKGTVKLGLDSGVTMGTMGEGGTAGLDIVTFSWSKGLFLGISLDGLAITASETSNASYYGVSLKPEQILSGGTAANPGADRLRAIVGRYPLPQE